MMTKNSAKPMQMSTDSVICPYCGDVQGIYPDDFASGEKFEEHGGYLGGHLLYVCDKCCKSYRIVLKKTITVTTIGDE